MMALFTHQRTCCFQVVLAREMEPAGVDSDGSVGGIERALPSLSTTEVFLVVVFVVIRQKRQLRLLRQLFPSLQWAKPRVNPADTLPDACVILPDNVNVNTASAWKRENSAFAATAPPPS